VTATNGPVTRDELRRLQIFRSVNLNIVEPLLTECPVRTLAEGEELIAVDRPNDHLYLLLSGRLSVHLGSAREEPIVMLEEGEIAGELSLIDRKPTSAVVVAQGPCRVLVVYRSIMWRLAELSHTVSYNLLGTLSKRLRYDNDLIFEDRKKLRERVANLRSERAALRESEQRFRDFAQTAADWFWETDAELRLRYVEGRSEESLRQFRSVYLGRSQREIFSQRVTNRQGWNDDFKSFEVRRPFEDLELSWRCLDGGSKVLRVSGKPVFGEGGKVLWLSWCGA
jgi:CRP-like cAMP-binding protein